MSKPKKVGWAGASQKARSTVRVFSRARVSGRERSFKQAPRFGLCARHSRTADMVIRDSRFGTQELERRGGLHPRRVWVLGLDRARGSPGRCPPEKRQGRLILGRAFRVVAGPESVQARESCETWCLVIGTPVCRSHSPFLPLVPVMVAMSSLPFILWSFARVGY